MEVLKTVQLVRPLSCGDGVIIDPLRRV